MEVDQIQCKFPRISNGYGNLNSRKLVRSQEMGDQYPDDEEEGENGRANATANGSGAADPGGGVGGYYGWPSSRIVRVSRATGGKDRHSKVLTSKGLRDRRVRLSVNTAIQFYDLQDRLGYDQPSKAVEWLLTAAASSIAQLPPMNSPFVELSNNKRMNTGGSNKLKLDSTQLDIDGTGGNSLHPRQEVTKSPGGSSNSETSKGSGISISRSESRIKARKRAKERVLEKEKEKENESSYIPSFTELLNGGINCISNIHNNKSIDVSAHQTPNRGNGENMDYFASVLLGPPATTRPGQMVGSPLFSAAANHHSELQPFSFAQENLVSAVNSAAVTRGTLQSNSPSLPPRFPPTDGSPLNFFIGAAPHIDNHHHFLPGFDARLQLYYSDAHGDNIRQKGKEKN